MALLITIPWNGRTRGKFGAISCLLKATAMPWISASLYQSCKSYRAGFGFKFVKMYRADFRPAYKTFFGTISVTIFSLVTCICCAHRGDFCECSDCDFSSVNSICKHGCVLLFSAWNSPHSFWEGDTGEEISTRRNCRRDQSVTRFLETMAYKTSFSCP